MKKKKVDQTELKRWRELDAAEFLVCLADHAKKDPSFIPIKDSSSTRWHVNVKNQDLEILCTGPKFWDTVRGKGGGGAVDLVIYLFDVDFLTATRMLRSKGF
jgi:hypothetical protein